MSLIAAAGMLAVAGGVGLGLGSLMWAATQSDKARVARTLNKNLRDASLLIAVGAAILIGVLMWRLIS